MNLGKIMRKILIYYELDINTTHWETLLGNDKNVDVMYSIFIGYPQDNINNIMPPKNYEISPNRIIQEP